jgi:hypothetical protein
MAIPVFFKRTDQFGVLQVQKSVYYHSYKSVAILKKGAFNG